MPRVLLRAAALIALSVVIALGGLLTLFGVGCYWTAGWDCGASVDWSGDEYDRAVQQEEFLGILFTLAGLALVAGSLFLLRRFLRREELAGGRSLI